MALIWGRAASNLNLAVLPPQCRQTFSAAQRLPLSSRSEKRPAVDGMRKPVEEKRGRLRLDIGRVCAIMHIVFLFHAPMIYPQDHPPQSPAPSSSPAPTGMDLRWYDPIDRNNAPKLKRIEFGQSQKEVSANLGISDCEGKVCFLSLPLQAGWGADFGPELAGIFTVTIHFAEHGLYHIETIFPTGFFDYLEPRLSERYGAITFSNSSAERDQEVREWRAESVRIRLVKRWHHGNREEGSLSISRDGEGPKAPAGEKLPF